MLLGTLQAPGVVFVSHSAAKEDSSQVASRKRKRDEARQSTKTEQRAMFASRSLAAATERRLERTTKFLLTKQARKMQSSLDLCKKLTDELHEAKEVVVRCEAAIRCKEQEIKVVRTRAGHSSRERLRREVLTEDNVRLKGQVQLEKEKWVECKASLSTTKKQLRVEKDKVEGLERQCRLHVEELKDLRGKASFYNNIDAAADDEAADETQYSPWLQEETLRRERRSAVEARQQAEEANKHLLEVLQREAAKAREQAEKVMELEKVMQEQVKNLQTLPVRSSKDKRRVAPWVRLMYMRLLQSGVSSAQCGDVVRIVLEEHPHGHHVKISDAELPSQRFADQMRHELLGMAQIAMTVKIADHAHQAVVLGADEGTINQVSSQTLVLHLEGEACQRLGVDQLATHFSQESADKTNKKMEMYGALSKRVTEKLGKIDLSEAERNLVFSPGAFSGTITDQCNGQKKMNRLLDEMKEMKVAEWIEAATELEKSKRAPELNTQMEHVFCHIHAGINLASKFDEVFRCHGAASTKLRSNVADEAEEDNDVEPETAPDEFQIEAIVASRSRQGTDGASVKEYKIRWKGWDASYDTWEPAAHMLHADDMLAEHDKTGNTVRAGKATKVQRRSVSKLQQLVYEVGKLLCVQSGKGLKEDQKGVGFMKWCLLNDYKDQLVTHLKMKPVVGTRYFVYHYNPRIIFNLRGLYLEYIEYLRRSKTKPGLNRLEASVQNFCRMTNVWPR